MNDLISRTALLAAVSAAIATSEKLEANPKLIDAANVLRDMIEEQPHVVPQVYIDVTGGVADVRACTHAIGVNILDYDIQDNDQEDYCIDPDGDQVWIYGDSCTPNPDECAAIDNWPTVGEQRDEDDDDA